MALSALIIKARLGLTDEELVEQIKENPYLQFFIGLKAFQDAPPFDPSMMVYLRKRLPETVINVPGVNYVGGRVASPYLLPA